MDLSKFSQNEKLAFFGAVALIVGGVVGYSYGLTALGLLAAIAMLVLVFLPQLAPNTSLPGSRGSLMVAIGGVAGVAMALAFLSAIAGALLVRFDFRDVFFLVAVVGGLVMAWAGWQEFQSEGGKFQFGSSASTPAATTTAPPGEAAADPAPPAQPVSTNADPAPAANPAPAADPATDPEAAPPDERPTA
jgi:MFS family permease